MGNKDPAVRESALSIIHELSAAYSVPLATRALDDREVAKVVDGDEVLVAATALHALARMNATSAADRIIRMLADSNISVKLAAIDAVVELHLREAKPALKQLAAVGDPRVKDEAVTALRALQ